MTKTENFKQLANKYASQMRNAEKRQYCEQYAKHLLGTSEAPEKGNLSYMAAQAVRLTLHSYMESA